MSTLVERLEALRNHVACMVKQVPDDWADPMVELRDDLTQAMEAAAALRATTGEGEWVMVPRVLTGAMAEAGEQELAMGNDFTDAWRAAVDMRNWEALATLPESTTAARIQLGHLAGAAPRPLVEDAYYAEPGEQEAVGRFGNHPNPAIDFEIEVATLQGRLFDARYSIGEIGKQPETVEQVAAAIERAMRFNVGGDEGAVMAKQLLRALAKEAERDAGAVACPKCGAPCEAEVHARGGDWGWGTSDSERTTYKYTHPVPAQVDEADWVWLPSAHDWLADSNVAVSFDWMAGWDAARRRLMALRNDALTAAAQEGR